MAKRGKKYLEIAKKVDRDRFYTPEEAVKLVKEMSYTSFDGTVEAHLRMGLDPRRSEQQIRGVVRLPYGLGKAVRVLVFAAGEDAQIAREAGADFIISDDEGIQKIMNGWTDFDVAIAVPDMMRQVGRLGRVLGRRVLMPTPKTGTVVQPEDLPRVIDDGRLDMVHVLFPDPWWKEQHRVKRLFSPPFVDLLAAKLQPGGLLHFKSDVQEYGELVAYLVAQHGAFSAHDPSLAARIGEFAATHREHWCIRHNRPVYTYYFARR